MRRSVPLAGLVLAGALAAASSAWAVAGRDLLEPATGNETALTAQPIVLGQTVAQRVVLGPPAVRDDDWFVVRGRPGAAVSVSLAHDGDVDRRGLVLELSRVTSSAPRWWKVGSGRSTVARGRIGVDGRLMLHVRCAGSESAGPCTALGAIPYRLRVEAGSGPRRRPGVGQTTTPPATPPPATPPPATAAPPAGTPVPSTTPPATTAPSTTTPSSTPPTGPPPVSGGVTLRDS